MKLNNLKTIIEREYLTRVRKKSFLLITFLGPIFFAAICILPSLIMMMAEDSAKKVAVIDASGIVMPELVGSDTYEYVDFSSEHPDSVKARFGELEIDALVVISGIDEEKRSVSVDAYSSKPVSVEMKDALASKVNDAVEEYRVGLYQIDGLKQMMDDVKSDVSVSTYTITEEGEEQISSSEVYMAISMILSMIIYMFIAMFSGMVMQSVIEEKASRVVEVLVSSVKATELMFGKIIGVACVALTQFLLWILLTVVLVGAATSFIGFDSLAGDPEQSQQMMQMAGQMSGVDVQSIAEASAADGENDLMSTVLDTLRNLDYVQLIFGFVIYFILGYLLYASFFAAIGSAVENEADTQQLQIPVTIPLLLAFFIAFYAFRAPDSPIVFWGSMIPFTSPIVMLARIPFGVPAWELALSVVLLLLTFIACGWASAKIYKIGILMFGKKTTFRDLWKWFRQQ